MSKSWVAYHNAQKMGLTYSDLKESIIYTKAVGEPKPGERMWVIEGIGKASPKLFRLVDCFIIDKVDNDIPEQFKGMKKRIKGRHSFMAGKLPIDLNTLDDKDALESLRVYLETSPSMTGAGNKVEALEMLLNTV